MDTVSFLNNYSSSFVRFSWIMLLQSSILILILLTLDLLLQRKVRAVFRYCLWMLLLVKLVLPVDLALPYSPAYWASNLLPETKAIDSSQASNDQADLTPANISTSESIPPHPLEMSPATTPAQQITATETATIIPSTDASTKAPIQQARVSISKQSFAALAWLVAVLVMLGLLIQRVFFVKSLIRQAKLADDDLLSQLKQCSSKMGMQRKVDLRISPNATSPSVCGLINPVILMPADLGDHLSKNQIDAILMHELAHIKRGDLWVNLAQALLQIAYFYNPLLWVANAAIRRIREQAVDEMVLVAMEDRAEDYPETLLSVSKLVWGKPMLSLRLIGVVESKSALTKRIKHILSRPFPKSAKLGLAGLAAIIITGAILLPMAKANPKQPEFIIKGTVINADTGQPIAGAKVGDVERYAEGKQWTTTDSNGNYEYKTWYEEHDLIAEAEGYKRQNKGFRTKLFGSEKEKVIDFALVPMAFVTAEQVIKQADSEARLLNHEYIGSEHILLALASEDSGTVSQIFREFSIGRDKVRNEVLRLIKKGNAPVTKEALPLTPRAESVVKNADKWAKVLNSDTVKSQHVLLGLLQVEDGVGAQVLMNLGLNLEKAQEAIANHSGQKSPEQETNSAIPTEYIGHWKGQAKIIVNWTKQKHLPIDIEIKPDGTVTGQVGDSQFKNAVFKLRDWLTRKFNPESNWMIKGDLIDPIIKNENIKREYINLLFDDKLNGDGNITGGFHTSGRHIGDKKTMVMSGTAMVLEKISLNTSKTSNYSAILPNGVTVELISVSNYPDNTVCWQPNGSDLQKAPLFIKPTENKRKDNIGFVTKISGPKDISISYGPIEGATGSSGSTNVVDENGSEIQGYKSLTVLIPETQNTTSVTYGISTIPWQTLATHTGRGGTTTGSKMIIFSQAFETKDSVGITVSTKQDKARAERIVAIAKDGQIHTGGNRSGLSSNDLQQLTMEFPNLKFDDISEFAFQTRPYSWVTFKNVSLKPNFKTDVKIESEKGELARQLYKEIESPRQELEDNQNSQVKDEFLVAENYVAELPKAGKVELVSVCEFVDDQFLSWNPDGSKSETPIYCRKLNSRNSERYIGFVFRASKRLDNHLWKIDGLIEKHRTRKDNMAFNEKGNLIREGNYFTYTCLIDDRNIADIKLRIQPHNWSVKAEYDGKYAIGRTDDKIKIIESYDSGEGVKVIFESDYDNFEVRVVAEYIEYDQNNRKVNRRGTAYIRSATDATGKEVSAAIFRGLTLTDVQVFRFEIRPKEYEWVTFNNVSLKPNFKTDVQIEIKNPAEQYEGIGNSSSRPKERTINLPANRSIGMLKIRKWDPTSHGVPPHEYLAEARGEVYVPAGQMLGLEIVKGKPVDLSPLAELNPTDLQSLSLYHTEVQDTDLRHISHLIGLEQIGLAITNISDEGLKYLSSLKNLKELNLSKTKITDAGLIHLAKLSELEILSLGDDLITNKGLIQLRDLKNLKVLILKDTKITDEGLFHLNELNSLISLNLSHTDIEGRGLLQLRDLSKLEWLLLGSTSINDAILMHIGEMKTLKGLYLNETQITDTGIGYLKNLDQLEQLVLAKTKITDEGLKHFIGLSELKHLNLDGTLVSKESVENLKKALPNCRISWQPQKQQTSIINDNIDEVEGLAEKDVNGTSVGNLDLKQITLPDVDDQAVMLDLASGQLIAIPEPSTGMEVLAAIDKLDEGDIIFDTGALILVRGASSNNSTPHPGGAPVQMHKMPANELLPAKITVTTRSNQHYELDIISVDENGCRISFTHSNKHKVISINAQTDQLARIEISGKVFDKQNGLVIGNIKVHFVGAPQDDAIVDNHGFFSTTADRSRFHQCLLYNTKNDQPVAQVKINNSINEQLAQNLSFHINPQQADQILKDPENDGIFCDNINCKICSPPFQHATLDFRIAPDGLFSSRAPIPLRVDDEGKYRQQLKEKGPDFNRKNNDEYIWLPIDNYEPARFGFLVTQQYENKTYLLVANKPGLCLRYGNMWGIVNASATQDNRGKSAVSVEVDQVASKLLQNITSKNIGANMAIIVNGKVLSAPQIMSTLKSKIMILGNFTDQQVESIANALKRP